MSGSNFGAGRAGIVILCADEEIRDVLRYWLDSAGIPVAVAADGHAAAEFLEEGTHAGLVTDRFLPPWPGLDTILALKERHRGLRVVVIADGGADSAMLARVVGADALLERPLRRSGVFRALGLDGESA